MSSETDTLDRSTETEANPAMLAQVTTANAAAYVQGIFDRELGLTLRGVEVGSSRDDAMRELTNTTATLYADRVLRELIQNAYDGTLGATAPKILLRLDEREGDHGTLYVANDGVGFRVDNVDAVTNAAMSNKKPGNFIGHKGLGFRSVLLLSDHPEIYSVGDDRPGNRFDGFCFRFAKPDDERRWLEERGRVDMVEGVVGRTHSLQLPVVLTDQPSDVAAFAKDGFATLIKLPLRDAVALKKALNELTALLEESTPLALFLERIEHLNVEHISRDGTVQKKDTSRTPTPSELVDPTGTIALSEVYIDRRRYLHAQVVAPPDRFFASIEEAISAHHPVEKWRDWTGPAHVSVALPLTGDAKPGVFYAFLPTTKESPFKGFVDAPFFPNPDRQDISLANPLNSFLMDVVAELCVGLTELMATANETRADYCQAAVDALSWVGDPDRLVEAADEVGVTVGGLRLPSMRRPSTAERWARFDEIFDWNDSAWAVIDAARLVRVCDVPMLRRSLGQNRTMALEEVIDAVSYVLTAEPSAWTEWAPKLAGDFAGKARTTRRDWEAFYADLSRMPTVLPHLAGTAIFRTAEGSIANANSKGSEAQVFVNADLEGEGAATKRLSASRRVSMPPGRMAKRMILADPQLSWPRSVVDAFVAAGLVDEYSIPKLLARSGALLGKKPLKQSVVASLGWAFALWRDHRSNPADEALKLSNLQTPLASGKMAVASMARFSAGWRDTQGDLLADLCRAGAEASPAIATLADHLLPEWDDWPLKDKGTSAEWRTFLSLIGVRDGLIEVYYKFAPQPPQWWRLLRVENGGATQLERRVGGEWRRELSSVAQQSFSYQSNNYDPEQTIMAFPAQAEYAQMSEAARLAYAKLIVRRLEFMPSARWTTVLLRRGGNYDRVEYSSPLKAFLSQAAWLPLARGDDIVWTKPGDTWFAPKSDPLPRFVRRIEQGVREVVEAAPAVRKALVNVLGVRLWNDDDTAVARVQTLGDILSQGINEADHDIFKKEYREAWQDLLDGDGPQLLGDKLVLPVDIAGRLTALPVSRDDIDRPAIFVGDAGAGGLGLLVGALGHPVVTAPAEKSSEVAEALAGAFGGTFRRVDDAGVTIYANGQPVADLSSAPLLIDQGREWLAEIFVLVLEQAGGLSSRNTPRVRQALYDELKNVRVFKAASLEIEVDSIRGPTPSTLQGVIPIPSATAPGIAIATAPGPLTWRDLTRAAGAIAIAIGRTNLQVGFRAAVLALAEGRSSEVMEAPDEEQIAQALMIAVERVRELQRSLRSSNRRLIEWLAPIVHALYGATAAAALLARSETLFEDSDILKTLTGSGIGQAEAEKVLKVCRDSDGLDGARRSLGIAFEPFNASLAALGEGWSPLTFESRLRAQFQARLDEQRPVLETLVRDHYSSIYDAGGALSAYAEAKALSWATFDDAWTAFYDNLPTDVIDRRFQDLALRELPGSRGEGLTDIDELRAGARAMLGSQVETVRRLVRVWVDGHPGVSLPTAWAEPSDQIVRTCLTSGVFDFRTVLAPDLPAALVRAGLWPATMPVSLDLDTLKIEATHLDAERAREAQRILDAQKKRRSVSFGTVEIDGGSETCLSEISLALGSIVGSQAFLKRSGPAVLQPIAPVVGFKKSGVRRTLSKDPEYMTDEQRTILGFAGEFAAYQYLKKVAPAFSDDHWVSSLGRRFLGLPPGSDEDGADFYIPRSRIPLYYEVKAHTGDPGYVDLGPSQVAKAAELANDRHGRWRILYVANVSNPASVTVHELDNPFSTTNQSKYRQAGGQGVRFHMNRE